MMEVPTLQEKSEQIFFVQPKVHQNKFADLNKTVPKDLIKLITSFEQCQATNKSSGILEKIAKDKKQPKNKITAYLPAARVMNQATSSIITTNIAITIEATNAIVMIPNLTIIIKMIHAMIVVNATTSTQRATSPTTRRMIASVITPKKRVTRPCTMTGPLCHAPAIHPKEGVNRVQDLLRALILLLGVALAQAAGATTTVMLTKMIASQAQPQSMGFCALRTTMTDITIARTKAILFFPPSLFQSQRRSAPRKGFVLCYRFDFI
jgi:hypothetical protein